MTAPPTPSGLADRIMGAVELDALLPFPVAIAALQSALGRVGTSSTPRTAVDLAAGQLLLMPSELDRFVGCKVISVAPGNPEHGLPRIQGVYLLMDAATLTPLAYLDGAELTAIRTPAVSAALVDLVAAPDARTLGLFGAGPQAVRHVAAMRAIRDIERVAVVGRSPARLEATIAQLRASGVDAVTSDPESAAHSDLIVCATSASSPVLADADIPAGATVVAVGSHEPHRRELPGELLGRSHVIVESREVATTEAGDVIQAIAEGHLDEAALVEFGDVATAVTGFDPTRPRVIKTCGVGWQDLVVAGEAYERLGTRPLA